MTKSIRSASRTLFVLIAALALFATACGGGAGGGDRSSAESDAAVAAGEINQATLSLTTDLATSQLLQTSDGSVTTLSDVVTGDRAVLLWYWAPH